MMPLLNIQNLSIRFGHKIVVNDVSLALAPGEILALVGESGSGKSLTAQAVLQLLPPEAMVSGSIAFADSQYLRVGEAEQRAAGVNPPSSLKTLRGKRVGLIFQEPMSALNPLHPIGKQIIESYCWHHKISPRSAHAQTKLRELLEAVGLNHLAHRGKLYPHQLSGGERQRAMIAMAIACDPELLIADEPTTALDVTLQVQILALLKELQRSRNMAMLFISHDLTVVRRFADRVCVMQQGNIVEQGTVAQVFANPAHIYTRMLIQATPSGHAVPLPAQAAEILRTDNLNVHFPITTPILRRTVGHVHAVNLVSLRLHAGETLGIVGESGSGKSSLAYAILRLVKSDGPMVFLGRRLDQLQGRALRSARRDFQPVFQDPYGSLNPRMTVGDIVAEGLILHGIGSVNKVDLVPYALLTSTASRLAQSATHDASPSVDSAVDAILTAVGLDPEIKHRYPHAFSGGQRQRIAIARAMILKPKLVILDEPTSALDLSVQATVLELLKSLQGSHGVAYLFISHDLKVIRSVAHQVLVLKKGNVVEQGPTEQIFSTPKDDYTKALMKAAYI